MTTLNCWKCGRDSGVEASDDNSEALCLSCFNEERYGDEEYIAAMDDQAAETSGEFVDDGFDGDDEYYPGEIHHR